MWILIVNAVSPTLSLKLVVETGGRDKKANQLINSGE